MASENRRHNIKIAFIQQEEVSKLHNRYKS